jgi:hemoglobin-like flavoprotein
LLKTPTTRHCKLPGMTPEQITLVESTIERAWDELTTLADDFYARLFEAEPRLCDLFTSDPAEQHRKFAEQLDAISCLMHDCDAFTANLGELGSRHDGYGVRPRDYALAGPPLLAALAAMLGDDWTSEVETAWLRAYNLTVEAMMAGAAAHHAGPG